MALVLDMVRVDPERRPSPEMQRWHRELAEVGGSRVCSHQPECPTDRSESACSAKDVARMQRCNTEPQGI